MRKKFIFEIEILILLDDKISCPFNFQESIDIFKKGSQTKIIETFEAENENPFEMQKTGWRSILNNFKKYTKSKIIQ